MLSIGGTEKLIILIGSTQINALFYQHQIVQDKASGFRRVREVHEESCNAVMDNLVGLVGLEPTTPALSRRCSNQLSYKPMFRSEPEFVQGHSPIPLTALFSTTDKL